MELAISESKVGERTKKSLLASHSRIGQAVLLLTRLANTLGAATRVQGFGLQLHSPETCNTDHFRISYTSESLSGTFSAHGSTMTS